MSHLSRLFLLLLPFVLFTYCEKKEPFTYYGDDVDAKNSGGVYIVNEGNFTFGNASLSFYDPDTKKVSREVFQSVNESPLGDVAESMTIFQRQAFISVNNSGKVYVMDTANYEFLGKITGLVSPRYVHVINDNKAYISDLYDTKITIFNPQTYKKTGSVDISNNNTEFTQHTSEQMISYGDYCLVNAWSFDNQILIIDTRTDELVDSIRVRKQPASMVMDKNDYLWVLTDGGYEGSTYGYEKPALMRIDVSSGKVLDTFLFASIKDIPANLTMNRSRDTLYFVNEDVYKMAVSADTLPKEPFIKADGRLIYALGIDRERNELYMADVSNYQEPGQIYRYNHHGQLLHHFEVGINPGFFCFE